MEHKRRLDRDDAVTCVCSRRINNNNNGDNGKNNNIISNRFIVSGAVQPAVCIGRRRDDGVYVSRDVAAAGSRR